jgi:hypothetical protein
MRKILLVLSILLVMTPSMAMASLVIDRVSGYYSGNGGEFTLYNGAPSNGSYNTKTKNIGWNESFQTFCLETAEFINPGGTYNFSINLENKAVYGGAGPLGDQISVGTSWLYSQFAKGILSGYNYVQGTGRAASAEELQQAIAYLEDEVGGSLSTNMINLLTTKFGSNEADWKANAAIGTDGVYVLNLTTLNGDRAQDQLYFKETGTTVPIPAAFWLLGSGLVGLVGLRRKIFS